MDGAKDADGILFRFQRKKSEIGMGGAPLAARRHVIWFSHFFLLQKSDAARSRNAFSCLSTLVTDLTMKRDVLLLLNRKKKQMKRFFLPFFLFVFLLKLLYHKLLSSYIARVRGNENSSGRKKSSSKRRGQQTGGYDTK